MLQTIRDGARGWLAWIIIGLIIIPFALWGIQEYIGDAGEVNVARVEGTDISLRQFQQSYEQQRSRLRAMLGANANLVEDEKIKKSVLEAMIKNELLRQSTDKLGLRVANAQLAQQIQSMPEFKKDGQFSKELFTQTLRSQGLVPERFEGLLRYSLLNEQLNTGITSTAILTQAELDEAIRLKNQQREIGYLILPWAGFKKDVVVDDAAIAQYYEKNKDRFINPEQASIQYLELSAQDIAVQIKPDEQELRKLYDEQRANFAVEEQRRASHMLLAVDKAATEAAVAAAKAKAESALQRLRGGEDFAKVAQELSQDAATAKQGGDLGLFGKGVMDKAFEDSAFALKVGELSGIVKSGFGFHIIKVTEIKPAHVKSFEEARAELDNEYRQRKAEQQFFEKAETMANLVYENPDTLEIAAKELGLPIKTSEFFTRKGGSGIAAEPKVINAAFSDEVLARGYNSEPIEIAANHRVVIRIKEHKPASPRSLAEAKQDIAEQLRTEAAQQKARRVGDDIRKRLTAGEDPQVLAKQYQVKWEKPGPLMRDAGVAPPAIVQAAFRLERPGKAAEAKHPITGGVALDSGDYAVVALYSVRDGSPAAMEAAERLALQRQLQRTRAEHEYQRFVDELRRDAKVVVQQDKL